MRLTSEAMEPFSLMGKEDVTSLKTEESDIFLTSRKKKKEQVKKQFNAIGKFSKENVEQR